MFPKKNIRMQGIYNGMKSKIGKTLGYTGVLGEDIERTIGEGCWALRLKLKGSFSFTGRIGGRRRCLYREKVSKGCRGHVAESLSGEILPRV